MFLSFLNFGRQNLGAFLLAPIILTAFYLLLSCRNSAVGIGRVAILLYLGRISYALYLWHWVILVLAKVTYHANLSITARVMSICLSILLADLTTRFVEQPIRGSIDRITASKYLFITSFSLGVIAILPLTIPALQVRDLLFSSNSLHGNIGFDEIGSYVKSHKVTCPNGQDGHPTLSGFDLGVVSCLQSDPDRPPDFVIIGDSHAGDLFVGFSEAFSKLNVVAILFYGSQGFPTIHNPAFKNAFNYLQFGGAKYILFSNMWSNPGVGLTDGKNALDFDHTIRVLSQTKKTILIADDRPYFPFDPQGCKYVLLATHLRNCSGITASYNAAYAKYLPILEAISRNTGNTFILNMRNIFCSNSSCTMSVGKDLMFADRSHLNILGSKYVANELIRRNAILELGK